jgi:transcriptional regulator with XRE-family HTH domain
MSEIPTTERLDLAARFKNARTKKELSVRYVASEVGIGEKALYHWESGHSQPDLTQLQILCKLYGVHSDFLLFGKSPWPFQDIDPKRFEALPHSQKNEVQRGMRAYIEKFEFQQGVHNTAANQAYAEPDRYVGQNRRGQDRRQQDRRGQ